MNPVTSFAKGTFLSLLLTTCAAITACTEKEDLNVDNSNNLQVTFGVNGHGSRGINRETSLPDGSQVGARLSGYAGYENLVYTASTGKTPQTWTGDKDVALSDVSGTLYAYYPYSSTTSINAIEVDMTAADQTDWLYGVPATGINDLNPEVDVTMNHALANINLSIVGDNYAGAGNISSISVQSDGIASKGTFNAAQATPGYTAFTVKGEALERSVATTLGATATDIMVIPTGTEAAITFFVTVDDVVYTVKSAPLTLEMGYSYQYTLKLKSTYMSVDGVSVTPWNNVPKEDNLELEKYDEFKESVIATYYVDEASLTSRAAGVEVQLLSSSNNFYLSLIDRMQVDGVEVTPAKTYTFTSGGSHTVKYLLKDNTILPNYMFNGTNVTEMTIPNSVQTIGENAFNGCSGLTGTLTIPNSVTSIGDNAFSGCSGLTGELVIPNSVTSIGDYAFNNCSGLTGTLTIPNLVTSIGYAAFYQCTGLTSVTIGEGVQTIGHEAFYNCSGLTGTLTIPNSVKSIEYHAFQKCTGLTEVIIGDGVTSIGELAFYECVNLGVLRLGNSIKDIGFRAFSGNNGGLHTIEFKSLTPPVWDIGSFGYLSSSMTIIIPVGTETLYTEQINRNQDSGWNYVKYREDSEPENGVYYSADGKVAMMGDPNYSGSILLKNSITRIGNSAFWNCKNITSVTIPNSVTSIGNNVFQGCSGLTEVTIGSGVQTIGSGAFGNCTGLTEITSLAITAPSVTNQTFCNAKRKGVLVIPVGASGYDIWLQETYTSQYQHYLGALNWKCRENIASENGVYYSSDGKIAMMGDAKYTGTITIKDGVENIFNNAFDDCKGLTSVVIPNSVTSIGNDAFRGCSGLTEVTIGSGVTTIGEYTFYGCNNLAKITSLATTAASFGIGTFSELKSGGTLYVPAGATGYDAWLSRWTIETITE